MKQKLKVPYHTSCYCGNPMLTLGEQFLCKSCVSKKCCMSHELDSFNRYTCNTLAPMIKRIENGKEKNYCIGHWKRRTMFCRHCSSRVIEKGYDNWNYCKKHMPDKIIRDELIMSSMGSILNPDLANLIKSKL